MRNLGLDLLRLIAIFLVLGRHLDLSPESNVILRTWQTGGWIGVDLFFVLSGFLVSGLIYREYQKEGSVNIKRFLIRRGFKIYPAFYFLIAVTMAVSFIGNIPIDKRKLASELLFFQNYFLGLWNHTWSLAVEEHFYIGIAFLTYIIVSKSKGQKNPFYKIPVLFISTAVFCLSLRFVNIVIWDEYSDMKYLFGTHLRIDSLMFGVLISYLWHFRNLKQYTDRFSSIALSSAGLMFLLPAFIFPLEEYKLVSVLGLVSFYIGSGLFVLMAIRLQFSSNRVLLIGGSLGVASYSIYLWHLPVSWWGWPIIKKLTGLDSFAVYFAVYILGSLGVGFFMNKVLEWPTLRLRDRLFPMSKK